MGTGYESTHGEDDLEKRQRRTANSLQEFMESGRNNPVHISPLRSKISDTLNISSRTEKTEPSKEAIAAARGFLFNLQTLRPYIEYIHKESGKRKYDTWFEDANSILYPLISHESAENQLQYFLSLSKIEIVKIREYLSVMDLKISMSSVHLPNLKVAYKHIIRILMRLS